MHDTDLLEGATPSSVRVDIGDEAESTCLQSWSRTPNARCGSGEGQGGIHPENIFGSGEAIFNYKLEKRLIDC